MHEEGKQPQYMEEREYRKLFGLEIYLTPVFVISSIAILAFIIGALVFQEGATKVFGDVRVWLTTNLDWLFMITANLVLLFCLFVAFSPLGKIRLGGADAKPEYSNLTWLAMLFAAGVGIGLLFFGVAEPTYYFQSPPLGITAGTPEAATAGIAATVFHWGLHGWAIYGVVGLALGFFAYNRGLPLTIRSVFHPLLGDRVWGWPGHIIDTFAIFAGLFGLATSLGLGVQQVTSGLNYLFKVPANNMTMVVLIVVITAIALISVMTGINVGIKRLSQFNIILAFLLLLAVIILGPTLYILSTIFTSLGVYFAKIRPLSNWVGRTDTSFLHDWTTFYWAWWIAWAPFVGTFIARISKGRTVRQFIFFVLLLPTLLCLLWFAAFGGTALHQHMVDGYTGVTENVGAWKLEIALFKMFDKLPLTVLLSSVAMMLTIIFFVTSSDSGSLIIDIIAAGGKIDAPVPQRVFWCSLEGLVAIALLLGGGLQSLQAASLATGFPFAIVLLGMAVCVFIGLRQESRESAANTQ
jgi:BCCT family betaine/carnitine transporter